MLSAYYSDYSEAGAGDAGDAGDAGGADELKNNNNQKDQRQKPNTKDDIKKLIKNMKKNNIIKKSEINQIG